MGTDVDGAGDDLLAMYELQLRARGHDERLRALAGSGSLPAGRYLSPRGREVVSAAYAVHLRPGDHIVTTYRGLYDHLAAGLPPRALWAEYLGRATGLGAGRAGPSHVVASTVGVVYSSGIVGAGLPVAAGLALAAQLEGGDRVTLVTFGDGAANTGAFHEALNLAARWRLPLVLVCHNDGQAAGTASAALSSVGRVAERAGAYALAAATVDGTDALALHAVLGEAVAKARRGGGPTLVEALLPSDPTASDPVARGRQALLEQGRTTAEALDALEAAVQADVTEAVQFALEAPEPRAADLGADVLGGAR
jgi:pyruvate dehydrogenase E1 component alpha subunit